MTNSKSMQQDIDGVQSAVNNPFALKWNEYSSHDCKGMGNSASLVKFGDDGRTISYSINNQGSLSMSWNSSETSVLARSYKTTIHTSGDKYEEVGVYLTVKELTNAQRIKNIFPGEVFDLDAWQVVRMPTPSDIPLVKLLHQYGYRESDIVVDLRAHTVAHENSDIYRQVFSGTYVSISKRDDKLNLKVIMTPNAYEELVKDSNSLGPLEDLTEILQEHVLGKYKPTWLLVAEMNLAEKLGVEVAQLEQVVAFVNSEIDKFVSSCLPDKNTGYHKEEVINFIVFSYDEEFGNFEVNLRVKDLLTNIYSAELGAFNEGVFGLYGDLSDCKAKLEKVTDTAYKAQFIRTTFDEDDSSTSGGDEEVIYFFSLNIMLWKDCHRNILEGLEKM